MAEKQFHPGAFVKGGVTRMAYTPADAVRFTFEGYKRLEEETAESVSYRELQAQAKEFGVKANQPADVLVEQIKAAAEARAAEVDGDSDNMVAEGDPNTDND